MLLGLSALRNQGIDGLIGERLAGEQFGSHVVQAAGALSPLDGAARGLGIAVLDDVEN